MSFDIGVLRSVQLLALGRSPAAVPENEGEGADVAGEPATAAI